MNRLVKAEWYRISHSSNLIKWIIFICIILFIMPAMTDIRFYEKDVSQNLFILSDVTTIFGTIFTVVLISICIGISYQNKMAYYEIMEGHSIANIIFSKLLLYISIMVSGVAVPYGIFLAVMAWKNGVGESDKILLRIALLLIIYIHICAVSVLITTSVRYMVAAVLVFLRFDVLESILIMIPLAISEFTELKSIHAGRISEWFVMPQYQEVLKGRIDTYIIAAVILSFLLECAFWFAVSYAGMKKKKYR